MVAGRRAIVQILMREAEGSVADRQRLGLNRSVTPVDRDGVFVTGVRVTEVAIQSDRIVLEDHRLTKRQRCDFRRRVGGRAKAKRFDGRLWDVGSEAASRVDGVTDCCGVQERAVCVERCLLVQVFVAGS